MHRGLAAALALLLVAGVVKIPMESALDRDQQEAGFRTAELDFDMRERLTQMTFLAALSGLRALVADMFWLKVFTRFENADWGRMPYLLDTVTSLQPRSELFWDLAHWHMAYNASSWAYHDSDLPSEALRRKAQEEYWELGRGLLERGIKNNPDSRMLWERLGGLLADKFEDHCAAAEAWGQAASQPDASPYAKRFAAYELARCPGREEEAYQRLMALYQMGERERKPTLLRLLQEMEVELDIPMEQRIYKDSSNSQE